MSDNVIIDRKLLADLLDFAENYTYADWYSRQKYGLDAEYQRLAEQVTAVLNVPEPAPAGAVTYAVYWQSEYSGVDLQDEGLTYLEAVSVVDVENERWGAINHWAVGSDGSTIGRAGAPE